MHVRVSFLALGVLEFLMCFAAVYVAYEIAGLGWGPFDEHRALTSGQVFSKALIFGLVMPVTLLGMGLYQSNFRGGSLAVFLRTVIGLLCGAAVLGVLYFLFPTLNTGRLVFATAFALALLMIGTLRPVFFYYVDKDFLKLGILVYGAGVKAASIDERMRRRADRRGFRIIGYTPSITDSKLIMDQSRVLKPENGLLELCRKHRVDEIIIAPDEKREGLPLHELLECKLHGIDVQDILTFFEREQGKLPLDILRPDWLIFSEGFDQGRLRDISKRAFDIVASSLILAVTWPFMLLAMLAIKSEEGLDAPVFYKQQRVGYLGENFDVIKFRSMRINAEKDGVAQWATRNDSRVTRVGGFMRKTRIDELPQTLNVLVGDMSFVGPRPERPQFVKELEQSIPYYAERHAVKPGITGWAQVSYPYGSSLEDSIQKQEFDLYYIKNHTIFLDILILIQTAEVVLFGKGAR